MAAQARAAAAMEWLHITTPLAAVAVAQVTVQLLLQVQILQGT
jgi:hypothetical protein